MFMLPEAQTLRKILIFGDTQIPDHDQLSLRAVYNFIDDFAQDTVILIGDMLNASTVSKYGTPADYHITLNDEILLLKELLETIEHRVRAVNPQARIIFTEGNHEKRVRDFLNRQAAEVVDLEKDGKQITSLPFLLDLDQLKIEWIPYEKELDLGAVVLLHGDIARQKSGYTPTAQMEKFGESVVHGHTHRLGLVFKTLYRKTIFGMETGCLCHRDMILSYTRAANWQQGLGLLFEVNGVYYPQVIPIYDHKFAFNNKIYTP